jgi:hypothetical protein
VLNAELEAPWLCASDERERREESDRSYGAAGADEPEPLPGEVGLGR